MAAADWFASLSVPLRGRDDKCPFRVLIRIELRSFRVVHVLAVHMERNRDRFGFVDHTVDGIRLERQHIARAKHTFILFPKFGVA